MPEYFAKLVGVFGILVNIDRQRHRLMHRFVMRHDFEFGMVGIIIRRHDRHRIRPMLGGMHGQLHRAAGIGRADVNHHRHAFFRLIQRHRGGQLALLRGHRRPLAGGTEDEQTLHACLDVKIDQLSHHLLVDPHLVIERRNDRQ